MRHSVVGSVLLALLVGLTAAPSSARAQLLTDARRIGMAGLSLTRDGNLRRYNPAYRAVPAREGQASLTIPIPLGLIQFFQDHPISQLDDDPLFKFDTTAFNPIATANLLLNLPLFYEVKKVPTPTNDVEFTIARNELIVNLGNTRAVIPAEEFGIGSLSRVLDPGVGFKGFRVGVMGFLYYDVGLQLGDTLRRFLRDTVPAAPNTPYTLLTDGLAITGFAPSLSFAGRLTGDSATGLYLGAALRYYFGLAYAFMDGDIGFTTGNPILATPPPYIVDEIVQYSKFGNTLGRGVGGDIGLVWISGPLEVGLGVNDIGATLTWSDTRVEREVFNTVTNSIVTTPIANHVETKTRLPVSYIANVAFSVGNTTLGGNVVETGRGTSVHVGAEQRVGSLALRGGVARDKRKKLEFGWGGGLYFGAFSLDVGFWTHSNSISNERAITMATSVSIY